MQSIRFSYREPVLIDTVRTIYSVGGEYSEDCPRKSASRRSGGRGS